MVYKHVVVAAFCIYAQRGEDAAKRGGWRLSAFNSHGTYIVGHGKSWKNHGIVFLNLCWNPVVITSFNINVHSEPSTIFKQMLMLQQQIYQEEQTPIGELQNNSTQFYSHYSKQSYTSSYYMNQQTWQPYGGCYQEKYQQKNYNNGYKCKYFSVFAYCIILHVFKKKKFRNTFRMSNSLDPDQDQQNGGPDLGPICLQGSAVDKSRH